MLIAPLVKQRVIREFDDIVATIPDALGALDCPVMALQGNLDINIHPQQLRHYQGMLAGRDAEFHLVRGVGHTLTNGLTPSDPPRIDPTVLTLVHEFLGSIPQR